MLESYNGQIKSAIKRLSESRVPCCIRHRKMLREYEWPEEVAKKNEKARKNEVDNKRRHVSQSGLYLAQDDYNASSHDLKSSTQCVCGGRDA